MSDVAQFSPAEDQLARLPAMAVGAAHAVRLDADGVLEELTPVVAAAALGETPHLLLNAPLAGRRLRAGRFRAYDLLELFAFVRPATFLVPSVDGLAAALGEAPPGRDPEQQVLVLAEMAAALLAEMAHPDYPYRAGAGGAAMAMARSGWGWGPIVLGALPPAALDERDPPLWQVLPEWEEPLPAPPAGNHPVTPEAARERLSLLVGGKGEDRVAQTRYAERVAATTFSPRETEGAPNLMLAEAGTGIGKTLGYVAPASLWAEANEAPVWIATFTKNLQRQLDQELDKLYPDPAVKAEKAVLRKGRENYLCLLNLQEALTAMTRGGRVDAAELGLIARWARYSRDGDMVGGDFPSWLAALMGAGRVGDFTDRRGECVYAACQHYRRCFIERAVRKARVADLVIANHALVMVQAQRAGGEDGHPRRIVFDEGHHLFDAADSAFSIHLTGGEGQELRRWIRGVEAGARGRARGLKSRIDELVLEDEDAARALAQVIHAAAVLPAQGWLARLRGGQPKGPMESFFAQVRDVVYARSDTQAGSYGLEVGTEALPDPLLAGARTVLAALLDLRTPLVRLSKALAEMLNEEADVLETATRLRIQAAVQSIGHRGDVVSEWCAMLRGLGTAGDEAPDLVDWLAVERFDGHDMDIGIKRHFVDPTKPLAKIVFEPAHGVLITSATLRDRQLPADSEDAAGTDATPDSDADWHSAEVRAGAQHLVLPPRRESFPSPFDYKGRTRVLIVRDVDKRDMDQIASAYRVLFEAAGGGALGLFTAISRLRATHARILEPLDRAGIDLYAQHVDPMDAGTLVDMFRAEEDACLMGTDAVRDGIDVPGRSLRLIVFDRVPWPRPTLLHKARKQAFGGRTYDDLIARLRLKQAYGRLVRSAEDAGVFVLLDAATPTRLTSAFPTGVEIERVGLAEAAMITREICLP